jgi:hypothetical protein
MRRTQPEHISSGIAPIADIRRGVECNDRNMKPVTVVPMRRAAQGVTEQRNETEWLPDGVTLSPRNRDLAKVLQGSAVAVAQNASRRQSNNNARCRKNQL